MSITIATHHIAWLQVEVEHVLLFVHIDEGIGYRLDYAYGFSLIYIMRLDIIVEVLTFNEVHHIVERAILAERVGDTNDVGMIKAREVDSFLLELLAIVLRQTAV